MIERPAVTHKSALDDLWKTTAEAEDGNVLTVGGVTSGLDLAVHLVEREFGATVAEEVRTETEYEPRNTVYRD